MNVWALFSASLAIPVLVASCGARSELELTPQACPQAGETRDCANVCGVGEQVCEGGSWQPCQVAAIARSCRDACGTGQQACAAGAWSECEVPSAARACSNQCGAGEQACLRGKWGACEVDPTRRACSDLCGSGEESCVAGVWQSCRVARVAVPCESVCGQGEEVCEGGRRKACNAPQPKPPLLKSVIRDFEESHPDFELPLVGSLFDPGLVLQDLGPDDKPVYANKPNSVSTSGRRAFDEWYRDTPGVNLSTSFDLQLAPSTTNPGLFIYDAPEFFPIDGQLFGNQGRTHNYHFTLEASTQFQYLGGEVFRFNGDDDMWVFINRRLAIDLGGTHTSLAATVNLDEAAGSLGLLKGATVPLHFFFAERHTVDSHFTIETSISEPGSCD